MHEALPERAAPPPPAAVAVRLALAYQASQALHVAVRLDLPGLLSHGPATSREIALRVGAHRDPMHRLLRALAAFEIVEDLGEGRFMLTPVGEALCADRPQSVRPLVLMYGSDHARRTFEALADCVQTGRNAFQILHGSDSSFAYLDGRPDLAQLFDDAMGAASSLTGPAIARSYDFAPVRHVVDVGGGRGTVLAAVLRAHPHLRGTLFDLPRVVADAPSLLAAHAVGDRCDTVGGDMFDAVPQGGDLYLLSHVVHNWDDARATRMLRACRRAMGRRSALLILDRVMPERITADPAMQGNVLMDLTMMVRTGGGRERTAGEFEDLLAAAELRLQRIITTPLAESLLEVVPAVSHSPEGHA